MMHLSTRTFVFFLVVMSALTSALATALVTSRQATAAPALAASPLVAAQVLPVNCASAATFTGTFTKAVDVGTFAVQRDGSITELTFYGRLQVDSLTAATNAAIFELRVDGVASSVDRARATVRAAEVGSTGIQASMSGLFTGLTTGNHTASIWVQASNAGSGTGGRVDPGCFSSDHLVIKEYLPFGTTALPLIRR